MKKDQEIIFDPIPEKTFRDPDFVLSARSVEETGNPPPDDKRDTNLTLSYVIDNPDVAVLSKGRVFITGAGSTSVTASQSGNDNYEPAANVSQSLVVNKAALKITSFQTMIKVIGEDDFVPGAIMTFGITPYYESENESVATIVGNFGQQKIHIVGIGSAWIKAYFPESKNYKEATDIFGINNYVKGALAVRATRTEDVKFHPCKLASVITTKVTA